MIRRSVGHCADRRPSSLTGRLFPLLAVALLALASGCGSGDDEHDGHGVAGPLPAGPDEVQAYTEDFVAGNPLAYVRPEHLIVVQLEPTEEGDTQGDTCAARTGVDCIPYFFEQATQVDVAADEGAAELERLMLIDAAGRIVLEDVAGGDPSSAVIEPGAYVLELHHAAAGDADREMQTVFVRPVDDGELEDEKSGEAAGLGSLPRVSLQARSDCIRCDFTKAELFDQNFDGLTLIGSNFYFTRMVQTTFRRAVMDNVSLTRVHPGPILAGPWSTVERNQRDYDADFTGAILTGATLSFFAGSCIFLEFVGIFRDARLEGTTWASTVTFNDLSDTRSCLAPDFRNAKMRGSKFTGIDLQYSMFSGTNCTFQGADLTGADFSKNFVDDEREGRTTGTVTSCDFSREPGSKQITTLAAANLSDQVFVDANFAEADLSQATLKGTEFHGQSNDLSRVNLTGAEFSGPQVFRGVNLSRATIDNLRPPSFNGLDLTGTTLSGIHFNGIDLSQADLSRSILVSREMVMGREVVVGPDFSRAKLSDGRHGVNLSGQTFPAQYPHFKGADLRFATLERTTLLAANLAGAKLNSAKMVGANLNFADLHRASMQGATLGVQPGTEGVPASLRGAYMTDVDLSDADLRSVDLTEAHLYGAETQTKLLRTRLDSANLSGAICSGARFSGTLNNAVFNGAQVMNAVFNGATLTGVKFDNAYLQGANFSNAISTTGVSLSNAAIAAEPGVWNFEEQDGAPYIFNYEATTLATLATSAAVTCPNGDTGPCCPSGDLKMCLTAKLKPVRNGPNPPVPPCVPTRNYCFENCLDPPNFDHHPPCS